MASDQLSNWTQESGTWSFSGSPFFVYFSSSASAVLLNNTVHPDGIASGVVQCDVVGYSDGDAPRVIVGSNSAGTDYYCAELTFAASGTGTLKLIHHASGSDTVIGSASIPTTIGTFQTLTIIIDGHTNNIVQCNTSGGGIAICGTGVTTTGVYAGIGTGAIGSGGECDFKNWSFTKKYQSDTAATCQDYKCVNCTICDPAVIATLNPEVTISGVINSTGAHACLGTWCNDTFNKTFIFSPSNLGANGSSCGWAISDALHPCCCSAWQLGIGITQNPPSGADSTKWFLYVLLQYNSSAGFDPVAHWQLAIDVPDKFACSGTFSLPQLTSILTDPTAGCNFSGATCTVTL